MLRKLWLKYKLRQAKRRHEGIQLEIGTLTMEINALHPESLQRVLYNREAKNILFPALRKAQDEIRELEARLENR